MMTLDRMNYEQKMDFRISHRTIWQKNKKKNKQTNTGERETKNNKPKNGYS